MLLTCAGIDLKLISGSGQFLASKSNVALVAIRSVVEEYHDISLNRGAEIYVDTRTEMSQVLSCKTRNLAQRFSVIYSKQYACVPETFDFPKFFFSNEILIEK